MKSDALTAAAKSINDGVEAARAASVLLCEGLLSMALAAKTVKPSTRDCIRHQLAEVAGGKIHEGSIHPVILQAARALIS